MRTETNQLQKGQAIVLVALMIVALTGMLALTIDVGNSYTRSSSQTSTAHPEPTRSRSSGSTSRALPSRTTSATCRLSREEKSSRV
jgi:hypothetical protein